MSRQITLVSVDCGTGHACGLALGLKNYGKVTLVWQNKNKHKLDFLNPDAKFGFEHIPKRGDDLIIAGCITFDRLEMRKYNYKRIHIIITDGRFARNPDYYNEKFKNFDVLATGCKHHFRNGLPTKTYYQPFDLSEYDLSKNDKLTVAHSPFVASKFKEKGTQKIIEVISNRNVDFDLITGVSWEECLTRKAKAHIFVDQIDHYDRDKFKFTDPNYVWPALGKSGIEAMHLGCLVLTYGKAYNTEIPSSPIAWVTEKTFAETLAYYIYKPGERTKLARKGHEWALRYATYDFAARNVLQ